MNNKIHIMLIIGMFAMGCNTFIVAALLPQITDTLHQSIAITGQGMTCFSLAYFLSAPLFSIFLSKHKLKRNIQIALFIFILGNFLTLLAHKILLFFIGRVMAGIGAGIFIPSCVSLIVGISHALNRGRILSVVWAANSAGVVFGVPVGVFISSHLNWQWSLGFIISLSLLTLIIISYHHVEEKIAKSPTTFYQYNIILSKNILFVLSISFFTSLACLGLYSYIALIQSGNPQSLTITIFIWGLGGFVGTVFVGFIIDLIEQTQVIMVVLLLGLILTFILLPFFKYSFYVGLVTFFLWGMLGWATTATQQKILFDINEQERALLTALNASAVGLGSALGTAMIGFCIAIGFHAMHLPFVSAFILVFVVIGQSLLLKKPVGSLVSE